MMEMNTTSQSVSWLNYMSLSQLNILSGVSSMAVTGMITSIFILLTKETTEDQNDIGNA